MLLKGLLDLIKTETSFKIELLITIVFIAGYYLYRYLFDK